MLLEHNRRLENVKRSVFLGPGPEMLFSVRVIATAVAVLWSWCPKEIMRRFVSGSIVL